MTHGSLSPTISPQRRDEPVSTKSMLGPLLCWAVVFADIGTSIYYVPGILYGTVQGLAGFFVSLTLLVFILLTLKYTEVTHRFPQGGGVVTVAAQAIHPWFGALGGMFILVDYFLTAAISSLSGMQYLSLVLPPLGMLFAIPGIGHIQVLILVATIGTLALLGTLNWIGVRESAKVSLVAALIAFVSDLAILISVFLHLSFAEFLALIPRMFAAHTLTPFSFLVGLAGSFLAFSGLESISQLSPVMRQPHKKVAGIAMFLVVITIGLTSPLLTMLSTMLQPEAASDPVLSTQLISLLGGKWGGLFLQTEVAISASALLIFASNTAIIGAYHVFLALARMEFLPQAILKRNRLRGTPHYAIALATGIPVFVLLLVLGNIVLLGDMYAFGLLGAFTLTCLGLDIVRRRDWRRARLLAKGGHTQEQVPQPPLWHDLGPTPEPVLGDGTIHRTEKPEARSSHEEKGPPHPLPEETNVGGRWFPLLFFLGVLTTFLVALAWGVNLVTKPLATAFGGGVTILGMLIAYINYTRSQKPGMVPVTIVSTHLTTRIPDAILAVLSAGNTRNEAVIRAAVRTAHEKKPVVFLYLSGQQPQHMLPHFLEIVDPYQEDTQAKNTFGRAENLALAARVPARQYLYLQSGPEAVTQIWLEVHPQDMVIDEKAHALLAEINPDRLRYELTSERQVVHLLKRW